MNQLTWWQNILLTIAALSGIWAVVQIGQHMWNLRKSFRSFKLCSEMRIWIENESKSTNMEKFCSYKNLEQNFDVSRDLLEGCIDKLEKEKICKRARGGISIGPGIEEFI